MHDVLFSAVKAVARRCFRTFGGSSEAVDHEAFLSRC